MEESGTHVDSIGYGFVSDKRAGMMKYCRRRENVICNVSSVFILIERKWARNQERERYMSKFNLKMLFLKNSVLTINIKPSLTPTLYLRCMLNKVSFFFLENYF